MHKIHTHKNIFRLCVIIFFVFTLVPLSEFHAAQALSGQVLGASISVVSDKVLPRNADAEADGSETSAASQTGSQADSQAPGSKIAIVDPTQTLQTSAKAIFAYAENNPQDIFLEQNIHDKLPIASLTKLMTAIVAFEDPEFKKPITITGADVVNISPSLHLAAGDTVKPIDVLNAMLIGSANDAAQTLANHFRGGKDFIDLMNAKAAMLGMIDTHFSTPIGFDTPNNYSTAADLQKLVSAAFSEIQYAPIWHATSYSFSGTSGHEYKIHTSNSLISGHENIYSLKTGQTAEAGGNMIVAAADPKNSSHRLVSIIIGSKAREEDTLAVINYAFSNFTWSR